MVYIQYMKNNHNAKPFIVINESFICQNCGHKNEKLEKSCRNHCSECLFSLHVDQSAPGDRTSNCQSLMEPISTEHSGKKGWTISHKCTKCGKIMKNKTADDDNFDKIIELSLINNQNEFTRSKKTRK